MAEEDIQQYANRPIVIIGGPGLKQGPLQKRCSNCNAAFPIQVSTQLMISKAKKMNKDPIILCVVCFAIVRRKGLLKDADAFGVREGMKELGL